MELQTRAWSTARELLTTLRDRARRRHVDAATRGRTIATPPDSIDLDPKECALLVLGCQPGILADVPDTDSVLLKINAAIDIVRLHGGHVVFARIAFEDRHYRFAPVTNKEFSKLMRQRRFRDGTAEADIHQAVTAGADDIVVRTTRLGAFSTTNLDEQLTNLGVTTILVAGAQTSGAVLSTVREAADRDYRIIVLADCCVDADPETHRLLIDQVFPRQAEITTAAVTYLSMASDKVDKQRLSSQAL